MFRIVALPIAVAPQPSLPLINPRFSLIVKTAATAAGIAATALLAPWEVVRIIGMTVLMGMSYGIANDMIACRDCIEYFTVGHFYDGKKLDYRPLNTLNPNLNAIAWGAIATWHVCAIAGAFFSLLARTPLPFLAIKITALQLSPYLAIGSVITMLVSHVLSRKAQQKMAINPHEKYPGVPLDLQAGWEACNVRNLSGYLSLGVGGIVCSVAMIAARAGLIVL